MKSGRELDVLVAEAMGWIEVPFETAKRNPPEIRDLPATEPIWIFTIDRECKINSEPWVYSRHFGAGEFHLWSPSIDIAAAWTVVEKLATEGWRLELNAKLLHRKEIRAYAVGFDRLVGDDLERVGVWEVETAPLAICLAALKAVGVEVEADA